MAKLRSNQFQVASIIRTLTETMEKCRATPPEIAEMQMKMLQQFGINVPEVFCQSAKNYIAIASQIGDERSAKANTIENRIYDWIEKTKPEKICVKMVFDECLNKNTYTRSEGRYINSILRRLNGYHESNAAMRFDEYGLQRGFKRDWVYDIAESIEEE